ncbi:hypothetical protein [Streptomyces coffeae]|uniref:HNH endonuclease n=1 Tax=Streptomyces coffeae TaxID=621382 RepID=A0ABS1NJ76_9ACTN|nr:hypothetical protein [Streptomyces coffeae]MBL1100115.1 hypothetical protein [Streptomyces coffeae]
MTSPTPPGAWRGATEIAPDREVQRLAATGLVGYQQDRGRLLHCLHHKPAPASRYADFHEVTAEDLPDGGICVHPSCGADLLAVLPTPRHDEAATVGPRCGNNPNAQLTNGDRKAVAEFKAYLVNRDASSSAAPADTGRRVLTPDEYSAAWHAVEGAASEPDADPGTVLHAVLDRLGIQSPPTA